MSALGGKLTSRRSRDQPVQGGFRSQGSAKSAPRVSGLPFEALCAACWVRRGEFVLWLGRPTEGRNICERVDTCAKHSCQFFVSKRARRVQVLEPLHEHSNEPLMPLTRCWCHGAGSSSHFLANSTPIVPSVGVHRSLQTSHDGTRIFCLITGGRCGP